MDTRQVMKWAAWTLLAAIAVVAVWAILWANQQAGYIDNPSPSPVPSMVRGG